MSRSITASYMNNPLGPQYFKKLHPRVPFTQIEDELLIGLVNRYGVYNWKYISLQMPGRNVRQCKERWENYLSPEVFNGPWTVEENELLVKKYEELGPRWKKISSFFPTRTDINIKNHWKMCERRAKRDFLNKTKTILRKNEEKYISLKIAKKDHQKNQSKKSDENTVNSLKKMQINENDMSFYPFLYEKSSDGNDSEILENNYFNFFFTDE